jgi:hypothetical protein
MLSLEMAVGLSDIKGYLFLRQVKSRPDCQGQNVSGDTNQAHVNVAYKLGSNL